MADAQITARIGGDASGLVGALEQGKQAGRKFADDFGKVMDKSVSFKRIFQGILQGVGIASVQQIADTLTAPFKEAAEQAQAIERATAGAADATERMLKARRSDVEQAKYLRKELDAILAGKRDGLREEPGFMQRLANSYKGSALGRAAQYFAGDPEAEEVRIASERSKRANEVGAELDALEKKEREEKAANKEMVDRWAKTLKAGKIVKDKAAEIKDEGKKQVEYVTEQIDGMDVLIKKVNGVAVRHVEITASMKAELGLLNSQAEAQGKHNLLLKDTIYLMGKAYGTSLDQAEFEVQSDAALKDLIKKNTAEIAVIEAGKGRGLTAGADAATGFLPQGIVQARLGTDIQRAQYQLDLRNKLRRDASMGGIENARAKFQGSPFEFEQVFNRFVKDGETSNELMRKQTDELEKIKNMMKGGIPVVFSGGTS